TPNTAVMTSPLTGKEVLSPRDGAVSRDRIASGRQRRGWNNSALRKWPRRWRWQYSRRASWETRENGETLPCRRAGGWAWPRPVPLALWSACQFARHALSSIVTSCAQFLRRYPPMRPLTLVVLALGLSLVLGSPVLPRARAADDKGEEKVKFDTVDGVELRGVFYSSMVPSRSGKKAPCVLLLHKIGGSCTEDGWDQLAHDLQKAGFCVLAFDFRGHGNSTSIDSTTFWQDRFNVQSLVKGYDPNKKTIAIKDFNKGYYPQLVNDIAAAKNYLDTRNDAGDCNSSSVVLIGAQDGATLGAMWLNAELMRYRVTGPLQLAKEPTGKDVAGAVWLSISPALGARAAPVTEWIKFAGKDNKIPMA